MTWGAPNWARAQTPTQPGFSPPSREQIGMQNSLNAATGWYGPQLTQNDIQAHRLAGQLGYGDAQYGMDVGNLNQNAALDRARLGLQQNNIGVDRDAIGRQLGVSDQLQALANQLFGLNGDTLDANVRTAGRGFDNAQRSAVSSRVANGGVGSVGMRQDLTEIGAQRGDTFGQFLRDRAGLGVQQQQSDINFKEDKAKLNDRLKALDNEAGKLGIDRKQLETNLQQGLAKLGVDHLFSTNDLIDAMQSNDIDRQALAQSIFREALGMSQFFIDQVPTGSGSMSGAFSRSHVGGWGTSSHFGPPTLTTQPVVKKEDKVFAWAKGK